MEGKFVRVGVREFRESMAEYLTSPNAVAITRHGQTVGYYIPARQTPPAEEEVEGLKRLVSNFAERLRELGIDEDEVMREFEATRHKT